MPVGERAGERVQQHRRGFARIGVLDAPVGGDDA